MNEIEIRDELKAKREQIKTFDDLVEFIKDVKDNYNCNPEKSVDMDDWYGAAPRVIAESALAVSWFFSAELGITGFQAGFIMWEFIRGWSKKNNKTGLRLLDFDNMLYPQYEHEFDKKISKSVWSAIQEQAKKNLDEAKLVHPDVKAHWQSIIDGNVPFGFSVKED